MRELLLLIVVVAACTTTAPADGPSEPVVAPSPTAPPSFATLELGEACGDIPAARAKALAASHAAEVRAALERWAPPAPVAAADRAVIEALAMRYVAACGRAEIVSLTQRLVAFRTVSEQVSPKDGAPFLEMAAFLRERAHAAGLGFNVIGENDAWEVTLGGGPRSVAMVTHADVVPVTSEPQAQLDGATLPAGWTHPPFDAQVVGERLYGRGTEDDKGAIAGALFALETLAKMGLSPRGTLVLAMGTAEESDWDGMQRYAAQMPKTSFVVSVDASFPVIFGEAGFVAWHLALPLGELARDGQRARAVAVRGGEFLTQVPAEASVQLLPSKRESLEQLELRAREAAAAEGEQRTARQERFTFAVTRDAACKCVTVTARGESVHSSLADTGMNALWALSGVAARLSLAPNGVTAMLELLARRFDGDHFGERLGVGHAHAVMGKLLVAPTVLRVEGGEVHLSVNMRRPLGPSREEFQAKLATALAALQAETPGLREGEEGYVGKPMMVEPEGALVTTLMQIYRDVTGDAATPPSTMRGGTYARLFDNAVNFGPAFPDRPYRGHAADEYIELGPLAQMGEMLLSAYLRLDAVTPPEAPVGHAGR